MKFNRWNAIDGSKLNINELMTKKKLDNITMPIGAIGCSLSHVYLWKYLLNKPDPMFLILEDDCIIPKNFNSLIKTYLKFAPLDWDILYLGSSNIYGKKINSHFVTILDKKNDITTNTGTYALLIKKKSLQRLLCYQIPVRKSIDILLKQIIQSKIINGYICNPPIVRHNNNIASMRRINSNLSPLTSWFKVKQNKIQIL
jgi:glycosyl transferase family 25